MHIQWPQGLNATIFLRDYWQKKPLLIRNALSNFTNPLSADELAGLAMEDGIASRLIKEPSPLTFTAEHGPFTENDFAQLAEGHWSLLVSDIEKHLPEMMNYVEAFDFIPSWLFDDLMISYAPTGGSVGPHTDLYDVFLFQAQGVRQWSLDETQDQHSELIEGQDLKILKHFKHTQRYNLNPGDCLYLPPGLPHYGISQDNDCMTWSFGCRSPSAANIVTSFANHLALQLPEDLLLSVNNITLQDNAGLINKDSQKRLYTMLKDNFRIDETIFATWLGRFLTESGSSTGLLDSHEPQDSFLQLIKKADSIQRCTQSRFAYITGQTSCRLFVNGDSYTTSLELAKLLCAQSLYTTQAFLSFTANAQDLETLNQLYQQDILYASN